MKRGIDVVEDAMRELEKTKPVRYSQGLEEDFILGAVPKTSPSHVCRFLDIGAWSATDKSNTRRLYEMGWAGVMIEPSPGPMRLLISAYGSEKRIQLVSAAVALEADSIARMHITDDALSTTEEKEFEKWDGTAHFDGILYVPVINPRQILTYFGEFDFVSIDTEGTSVDVFKEFLRLGAAPACICVEYNDRKGEALAYAKRFQYELIHENENNLLFERSR